jgi:hypothetical protein
MFSPSGLVTLEPNPCINPNAKLIRVTYIIPKNIIIFENKLPAIDADLKKDFHCKLLN